jgi:UDP-glucose 4-epimerase
MTTVAVTGCASRFARVLLPLLEANPQIEKIVGIDLTPPAEAYSKLEFHQQDIRDARLAETLRGCETLVHLAFIVGRPYKMPLREAASINLQGTWNACRAAASVGARKLVISSSIAAYGGLPDNPDPLVEDSPLRGLYTDFYYSQHKHANEIWLDGLQLEYPKLLITRLRPCIVMGPHQSATALLQPNNSYFTTRGTYQARLQLVHEDDLAAAFDLMVRRDLPGAYNVVGDEVDSFPHMAEQAGLQVVVVPQKMLLKGATLLWKQGMTNLGPEWLGGESAILCSNAKLKATGAWTPRYTTAQSFIATVEALRASVSA